MLRTQTMTRRMPCSRRYWSDQWMMGRPLTGSMAAQVRPTKGRNDVGTSPAASTMAVRFEDPPCEGFIGSMPAAYGGRGSGLKIFQCVVLLENH